MNKEEPAQLSDEQLLAEAKKLKSSVLIRAMLSGFLVGVMIYTVIKDNLGLVTFIPLFFIFLLVRVAKRDAALKEVLQERGLK